MATAQAGATFKGMVGTYPCELRYFCDKIKETNDALKSGTPLPKFKNRIILYGPPGNGKTTIVHKIAEETDSMLFESAGADIVQRHYGDGASNIAFLFTRAFEYVEKEFGTAIIFIDEIDAFTKDTKNDAENREYLTATQKLWTELDNIKGDTRIAFICATNNFKDLNKAFLGRFGSNQVEIKNPDEAMRREVLSYYAKEYIGKVWTQRYLDELAKKTKDLNIRDLEGLIEGSFQVAKIENNGIITANIVENVLEKIIDATEVPVESSEYKNFIHDAGVASAAAATAAVAATVTKSVAKAVIDRLTRPPSLDYDKACKLLEALRRTVC